MATGPGLSRPYIFLMLSYNDDLSAEAELVKATAAKMGYSVCRSDSPEIGEPSVRAIEHAISDSSVTIAFVTTIDTDFMMQVGYARGINKPVLLFASDAKYIATAFRSFRVFVYDLSKPIEFAGMMESAIREAVESPDRFHAANAAVEQSEKQYVFVSYCHQDREYLDRLLVHFKPLERDHLIDLWVDSKLRAGDLWKKEVEHALEKASVAVLLISADYLASDFITNNELPPLLSNAEKKGTRIMPVVLKPCRFSRDRALREFQSINDPKDPLISLPEGDRERYYDLIAKEVERSVGTRQRPEA
jgi:hypothetical protein